MNKIETIIAALQFASDNSDKTNFEYHIVEKALAAAHELKALKPVLWKASGDGWSYEKPLFPATPLYALDEVKHD